MSGARAVRSSGAHQDEQRTRLLDAAERVFYAHGIQAVGMDQLRTAVGLPMKRMYELFPSKDAMVVAALRRRHQRLMAEITDRVDAANSPQGRVLAIFDYLHEWCRAADFRGCPWLNAYGELGPTNPAVAAEVHHHQREFRELLTSVPRQAGCSTLVANAVHLLATGALAAASVQHTASPAAEARATVVVLLEREFPTGDRPAVRPTG